jgi:hypothetical protein
VDVDIERLTGLLKEMNESQVRTDALGGREVAWYYWRGEIAESLGLPLTVWDVEEE